VSFHVRCVYNTCRTRNNTNEGVVSCSASLLWPPSPIQRTTSTNRHPRWCFFVLGVFSPLYHARQARNDTSVGVISCSDPFLSPRMNFEGSLFNILSIIIYIFNSIYSCCFSSRKPAGILRESRTRGHGTGILRVRARGSQKHPAGHPCPSLRTRHTRTRIPVRE